MLPQIVVKICPTVTCCLLDWRQWCLDTNCCRNGTLIMGQVSLLLFYCTMAWFNQKLFSYSKSKIFSVIYRSLSIITIVTTNLLTVKYYFRVLEVWLVFCAPASPSHPVTPAAAGHKSLTWRFPPSHSPLARVCPCLCHSPQTCSGGIPILSWLSLLLVLSRLKSSLDYQVKYLFQI